MAHHIVPMVLASLLLIGTVLATDLSVDVLVKDCHNRGVEYAYIEMSGCVDQPVRVMTDDTGLAHFTGPNSIHTCWGVADQQCVFRVISLPVGTPCSDMYPDLTLFERPPLNTAPVGNGGPKKWMFQTFSKKESQDCTSQRTCEIHCPPAAVGTADCILGCPAQVSYPDVLIMEPSMCASNCPMSTCGCGADVSITRPLRKMK
eukprot:jgi/Chrzof1/2397/Cz11g13180.t1